jgi:hypothetical protein
MRKPTPSRPKSPDSASEIHATPRLNHEDFTSFDTPLTHKAAQVRSLGTEPARIDARTYNGLLRFGETLGRAPARSTLEEATFAPQTIKTRRWNQPKRVVSAC